MAARPPATHPFRQTRWPDSLMNLLEQPEKLVVVIASAADGERLAQALVQRGYPATRLGSAGGFLRRGNSTVISGVPAAAVEAVLAIVRLVCSPRTAVAPVQMLPLVGMAASGDDLGEVRSGGAVVFVLDISRFERI